MDNATGKEKPETYRVQFEIEKDLYLRAKRYFKNDKHKGYFGLQAFETKVNYLEGRDKRLQTEKIKSDAKFLLPIIQELIDTNQLRIN